MTLNILFSADAKNWQDYEKPLKSGLAEAGLVGEVKTNFAPNEVDYIVYAPSSALQDFAPYTRAKAIDGITCYHGAAGLERAMQGAVIINPGRGPLIDNAALIAALDSGQIGHATLDVFRVEPLPLDDAFWAHPKVTVTPHIASETRIDTAAQVIVENIRRGEAGEAFFAFGGSGFGVLGYFRLGGFSGSDPGAAGVCWTGFTGFGSSN
jgi:hypothetical protein